MAVDGLPIVVEGDEPEKMHQLMAAVLEKVIEEIRQIKRERVIRMMLEGRAGQ